MILWFANRGTGVVLVLLLTLSTVLGVLATARTSSSRWPRFATQELHRNVALLSMVLLGLHVASAVADDYVDLTWYDVIAPVSGTYAAEHRFELALGSLAFNVLVLVVVTSALRERISPRLWRALHLATYPAWAAAVAHGLLIGTDRHTTWAISVTALSAAALGAAAIVRLVILGSERRRYAAAGLDAPYDAVLEDLR